MLAGGRWVRRGSTIVLYVDRRQTHDDGHLTADAALELPLAMELAGRPVLRNGSSGSDVVYLQGRLAALGLSPGSPDGRFGSRTEAAVKAFQRSRSLSADGIVGAQTWSAIDSGIPSAAPTAVTPFPGPTIATGTDAAIESLNLAEPARSAAYTIKRKHPWVVFTSGRRDAAGQAWAMAGNVVHNRRWIAETYAVNSVSAASQSWVDAHPEARTQPAIANGLLSVFKTFAPRDLGRLSHHMSGLAFDVKPEDSQAPAFWSTVRSLPGLRQHFDVEGGRKIWHVGF